ncbi:FAD-dependent oxidoreductase [Rhodococcus opacus]|uniref:FAD-dependent oxidoreductase n=1 Tax=Rhodococcus opacus TaxID=37919 RepID=UPI001C481616|nr:FAD-dependent oxidoreductase [Rhodococcus opacus]MBV6760227.1 FAD-dependent oxidoreductase [Rhodococcus opacus]
MKFWTGSSSETSYDVVIVGSGAAALLAADVAATAGKSVLVLEKAAWIGGTSAISGGTLWIPNNPYMLERGLTDSTEAALAYLRTISRGHTPEEILRAVVEAGPEMISWAYDHAGLVFASVDDYPDYRPDVAGSVPGGRSLDPALFDSNDLGPLKDALRPDRRMPFTMAEYEQWVAFTRFPWEDLQKRYDAGIISRGNSVVAPLLKTAADLGVTLVTEARVDDLLTDGARVAGVIADGVDFTASSGVMLGCGGFEWDLGMAQQFLAGPVMARCSPPNNTGDGIRMGQKLGAKLGNMREAFWAPMTIIPGDLSEGEQLGTLLRFERQGPGSIIVNKLGKRFVNESQNYNDMTRAFHAVDPVNHDFANLPAHIVVDHEYMELYGFLTHRVGEELPEWMKSADTLDELGALIGVPEGSLAATVERFNEFARLGTDPDFTRGANDYDQYWGDGDRGYPNRSLAPLDRGPFYAVEIVPGAFGTNGGLVTDAHANVLDADGAPIAGLYAAGNTSAHPVGGGYPGAGGTLGPGMTMAYLAGQQLAAASPVRGESELVANS